MSSVAALPLALASFLPRAGPAVDYDLAYVRAPRFGDLGAPPAGAQAAGPR